MAQINFIRKPQDEATTERRITTAPEHYSSLLAVPGPKRFAVVRGARRPEEVAAYLPNNYAIMESFETAPSRKLLVIIGGIDEAGWTLDDYVRPRLGSGLMAVEEIA